ncbi:hypothetical protein LTR95_015496, partial [Oleoguttula sp. CCFEE 5521]
MSDDEADPELIALLRSHLGLDTQPSANVISSSTGVLADAEYIYNNSIDVSVSMSGTQSAAVELYNHFTSRYYSAKSWNDHPLHPTLGEEGFDDEAMVRFVFTMDLLNFSFWSELGNEERWQIEWRGERWTGYSGMVAGLRKGLEEGRDLTDLGVWEGEALEALVGEVFRGETGEGMPMLRERCDVLRQAGRVLRERFGGGNQDRDDLAEGDNDNMPMSTVDIDDTVTIDEPRSHESRHGEPNESGPEHSYKDVSTAASDVLEVASETAESAEHRDEGEIVGSASVLAVDPTEEESGKAMATQSRPRRPNRSVIRLIEQADHSAGKLVNMLAEYFPCFRDETRFEGRRVRFLKRAQIFVADLWAAFGGRGYGQFDDIEQLTMFADYRVPQMLYNLGVLQYSPPLSARISRHEEVPPGHSWEIELR